MTQYILNIDFVNSLAKVCFSFELAKKCYTEIEKLFPSSSLAKTGRGMIKFSFGDITNSNLLFQTDTLQNLDNHLQRGFGHVWMF